MLVAKTHAAVRDEERVSLSQPAEATV